MIDITHKRNTLRVAKAEAWVHVGNPKTIEALVNKTVPKGDVLEVARTAGLFAVKNTANSIPDCHPLPVEYTHIDYEVDSETQRIRILIEVKTIYKTGVEVEAMHGASVVALTIYDMLKPIDKEVEIHQIRLLSKSGGKSDFLDKTKRKFNAGVVVCSDSISKGHKEDRAGLIIQDKLSSRGVEVVHYEVIADEKTLIEQSLLKLAKEEIDLIIYTGGTGLSPRDVTPDSIQPLLEMEIPGIAEAIRSYGMDRTPLSMLSRSVSGTIGQSLVLTLPGSSKGAAESMDAIFPAVLHIFKVFRGERHEV
ncbi:MAG: bifunctional molybdenum cofactor biosynthesis protein MoaC/MoaB [Bacteroidia bacterium]